MPDLCGNCAMNVPRMGICGRKPILVFFSSLPPIVLIALVFFCSESTEGGRERILGQWLVGSVRCSSFFLFSICALLCSDWEVLCLLKSLFSAWWVVLLIKPYHWYQPETPCQSFLSLTNQLQLPSWRFSSQLASAPTQGRRPARPKSTASGWLFRFDLSFSQSLDNTIIWL